MARWLMAGALLAAVVTGVVVMAQENKMSTQKVSSGMATAVFAGGCFWCMESEYHGIPGVLSTTVGFTGGTVENPSYEAVSAGGTGHVEALQVTYDPTVVTYAQLVDIFWGNVDPFDDQGQFCDKGEQYKAALFVGNSAERAVAEASAKAIAEKFKRVVATQILPVQKFWPADEKHQAFHQKNPLRYKYYRWGCGRDGRLEELRRGGA